MSIQNEVLEIVQQYKDDPWDSTSEMLFDTVILLAKKLDLLQVQIDNNSSWINLQRYSE